VAINHLPTSEATSPSSSPKIEVGRKVITQKPPYTRIWRQMENLIPE